MTQIGDRSTRHVVDLSAVGGGEVVLAWGSATDIGKRRHHNEDSLVVAPPVFAVADGLGGHSAGDVASSAVVTQLAERVAGQFADLDAIEAALVAASDEIEQVASEHELGVGTTVSGIALTEQGDQPYWTVFNIGDSRVYAMDGGELSQVTVDHSVVQEMVDAGMIRPEDAELHPDSNVITRAVGFASAPTPDYWVIPVRAGMRLLVCTDGLSKEVAFERLESVLRAGIGAQAAADDLVREALEAGGRDNVTVVVVDVLKAPEG